MYIHLREPFYISSLLAFKLLIVMLLYAPSGSVTSDVVNKGEIIWNVIFTYTTN